MGERAYKVLDENDIKKINKIVPNLGASFMSGKPSKQHDEELEVKNSPEIDSSIGTSEANTTDDVENDWQQKIHDIICPKTIKYVLNNIRTKKIQLPNIDDFPTIPSINLPFGDFQVDPNAILKDKYDKIKENVENVLASLNKKTEEQKKVEHMIKHCPGKWDEYVDDCGEAIDPPCAKVHNQLIMTCSKAFEGGDQVAAQCDKVAEDVIKWASQYMTSLGMSGSKESSQAEEVVNNTIAAQVENTKKEEETKIKKRIHDEQEKLNTLTKFVEDQIKNVALNQIKALSGI